MKTAVITGGAGGLGQALARHLQADGWHCALLDLPGALEGLQETESQSLHACDVTDLPQVSATVERLRSLRPSIDLAIYNAGVTLIAPFEAMIPAAHRRLFEVNYWGAVYLAGALLPDIRAAKGAHLAISSVAGFAPLRHRTGYAASKHALEGFFHSLRGEEASHGVQVSVAAPSFVATNLQRPGVDALGLGRPGAATDGIDYMPPEAAATEILRGLDRGRAMIPVGRVARRVWWLRRLAPGLYERLMIARIGT